MRPSPSSCVFYKLGGKKNNGLVSTYVRPCMYVLGHYPDSQSVQVLADRLSKVADVTV